MAKEFYTLVPDDFEKLRIQGPPGSKIYHLRVIGSFDYPRLPGPDYIRLLHLDPPTAANPSRLRGSLKVHKLDDECEYEAISYAWGDYPEFDQTLFLDGQILKISRNLSAALRAYCHPDRARILWADAICINQADAAEKTQQVAIMADIYSKAKSVQAWVTPASKDTIEAMAFMAQLASKAKSFGISDEVDRPRFSQQYPSVSVGDSEARRLIDDAAKAHVDYLVSRSWFRRVWIVQEVSLAAELIVSCGHSTMGWTDFARALETLRGALRQVPLGETRSRMEGLKPAWELVRQRDAFRLLDRHGGRNHHLMANSLWRQMSNRDCSDDRDRVYAMLALTKSPYTMTPDYEKTVAEAYTDFTRRYSPVQHIYSAGLCRRQHKTDLEAASTDTDTDTDTEHGRPPIDIADRDYLPSWVPEFRPSLISDEWASPLNGTYRTARQAPFYFFPHPGMLNVLGVTGTIFDIIVTTTWKYDKIRTTHCMYDPGFFFSIIDQLQAVPSFPPDSAVEAPSEPLWLILAKTLTCGIGDCSGAEYTLARYPNLESLGHLGQGSVAWLTAIWDCFSAHCFDPAGEVFQHVLLKALGAKSRPFSTDANIASTFLNYVANILVSDRLFVTTEGYIGLAPRCIRGGDFVAIFNGCDTPYVVRRAGKIKHEDEMFDEALHVVGPCYLHGIMNGEIFADRDAPRFKRLKWMRHDGDVADSLEGCMMLV